MPDDRGHRTDQTRSRRFPALPAQLALAIAGVPPSNDHGVFYYPCAVTLKDGSCRDFVYLAEARHWLGHWGAESIEDPGKRFIDVRDIATLEESQNRLPPVLANKIYEAGESGMGYTIFTIQFDDGSTLAVLTGNAVDFIRYPDGKSAANVTDVLPHEGRSDPNLCQAPNYYWCIFEQS